MVGRIGQAQLGSAISKKLWGVRDRGRKVSAARGVVIGIGCENHPLLIPLEWL